MDLSRQNVESAFSTLCNGNSEEINSANTFLMEWAQTPECYPTTFEIIVESNDLQVKTIALTFFYSQIETNWISFDDDFKNSINDYFFKSLSEELPSPEIANTTFSIIVLIALNDWPEIRPDYLELIFSLENHIYLFQIISEFLNLLQGCKYVIRSRLASLRQAFIEHNYVQIIVSLIQQVNDSIQEQDQSIIDQYTNIFLSIFNSLFAWCDIQLFLTQGIADYILSKIPNAKSYECLISLFINRTDSSDVLIHILPNLIPLIIENPNSNFLIIFLRKYGRMLEKADDGYLTTLYSLLLSIDVDIDDLDDFWGLWYVIIHRLFFSTNDDEENDTLGRIFSPLFDQMRVKFINLIPLAVSNGKVVDYSAFSAWELMNRIDKEGFATFFANLQQQLDSAQEERNSLIVSINYCSSSINFLMKTTENQELFGLVDQFYTKLLSDDFSMIDVESTLFALSRLTLLIRSNMDIFEKFGQLILYCFQCKNVDLKETAANCFCFALKEIPDFFATTASDFGLFFLDSVDELLKEAIEEDVKDDTFLIIVFRCASLLATSLTTQNEEEEDEENVDSSFFDLIADSVLSIMNENAPIALKIIAEIGESSGKSCIFAYRKFWDPLFTYAKMNDVLINEMVIDALIAGIVNCRFQKVLQQIKVLVEILLNDMEPEMAVSAISSCRERGTEFDEFYPFFENLLNYPCVPLFRFFYSFSPKLVKFETAIPLICNGIVDVDINLCNSALSCIKKFLNLASDLDYTELYIKFRAQILHSLFKALIDFSHCSLVCRLSSALIKAIVVNKFCGAENIEMEILEILHSLCQNEPNDNDFFENFIKSLVMSCDEKNKANQIVTDFLIMMKSVQLNEKVEILNRIDDEIDDDEKNMIDEIEKKLDIKADG